MTLPADARVDLHLHSTASDGSLDPAALVEAAVAGGLDVIAIADHDTTAGVLPALSAARGRLRVISAVEISAGLGGRDVHVLGYHIDPRAPALLEYASDAVERRRRRAAAIVERLTSLGAPLSMADVEREAGPAEGTAIGRPHIARALVERGHVRTVGEAFDRYLADDRPAFVATGLTSPEDAVRLIREAGGVAVWAHPPVEELQRDLPALITAGIQGLEVFRPRAESAATRRLRRAAERHGLLASGGSDWHGEWHGPLGTFAVPAARVEPLLRRGASAA